MELNLWVASLAGLVSFLSPCVLPLVPAYIGYMGGRVTKTVAAQTTGGPALLVQPTLSSRLSTFAHGVAFVAGFTFVFVVFGLLTTAFIRQIGGQNIALVRDIIGRTGGLLIIFFGLHFMGAIAFVTKRLLSRPRLIGSPAFTIAAAVIGSLAIAWALIDPLLVLPALAIFLLWLALGGGLSQPQAFWTRALEAVQRGLYADTRRQMVASGQQSYSSSALMGIIFAAGWTPCIGPIYGSILTLAATGADIGQAGALMIAYSLGLGIPFLLAALLLDSAQSLLRRLQRHIHKIELVSGLLLVLIGLSVASGRLQTLSQNFAVQFADFSYSLEECVVAVTQGNLTLGELPGCMAGTTRPAEAAQDAPEAEIIGILDLAASIDPAPTIGLEIGQRAPHFSGVTDTGETIALADLRGRPVLLNFWATWCGPCRIEMPEFEAAYRAAGEDGLIILAVNNRESSAQVAQFRRELGLTFPLLLDEDGMLQRQYAIAQYPSTYLIDADGIITARHFGPLTAAQIAALVGGLQS